MITPAFSTVACPEWTLEQVAAAAAALGWPAVELRTFGEGSREFASDPALTAPEKVRRTFSAAGIDIAGLGTSCTFDDPIFPPVLGHVLLDTHREVRAVKGPIDLAAAIEASVVRVFGYRLRGGESRAAGVRRISDRLRLAGDHAHRTGVAVAVENAGDFSRAADLAELIDAVAHPLVGACYNVAAGHAAGDAPDAGLNALADVLRIVRIKDLRAGRPVPLGSGEVPCRDAVAFLVRRNFDGLLVYEWDRAWLPELAAPRDALAAAASTLFGWFASTGAQIRVSPTGAPAALRG